MGLLARFARQWVAGETREDALRVAKAANGRGIDAIVNHLGEHLRDTGAVEATLGEYFALLDGLDEAGVRGCVSAKPTQFGVLIGREYAFSQLLQLLDAVKARRRALWIDMEGTSTTEDTIWIYERLFERYNRVGLCVQANLRRTAEDLGHLLALGARIRLTKGAYRETPDLAFTSRQAIDRQFLVHLEALFRGGRDFAVGSHDGRMIARAIELSSAWPTPFEFQFLQGVREPLKADLVSRGYRVLEYVPYGPNWLPYFSRRLRERPRNAIIMLRSLVTD